MALTMDSISVSDMDNNCYLLHDHGKGLLIDAAAEPDTLLHFAADLGVEITDVLTTHRHRDHVGALPQVLAATGAKHYASFLDSPALPADVDVELNNGDVLTFEGHDLPVIILRGHTPGGAALAADLGGTTALFVGDSLFPGGLGRTNSESDFTRLFRDVKERIFDRYPDEALVYPGHGKPTTLGAERPHLDEWWDRRW